MPQAATAIDKPAARRWPGHTQRLAKGGGTEQKTRSRPAGMCWPVRRLRQSGGMRGVRQLSAATLAGAH